MGQPLKGMRKVIAERMTASKHTAPHVTIFMDVRVDATIAFRKELNKREEGVRYSYTDLLVKMAAAALRRPQGMAGSGLLRSLGRRMKATVTEFRPRAVGE